MQFTRGLSLERSQFAIKIFTHLTASAQVEQVRSQKGEKKEEPQIALCH